MIFGNLSSLTRLLKEKISASECDLIDQVISNPSSEPGKYVVNENLFYLRFNYSTKAETEALWESHRTYVDIHVVIEGQEMVQFNDISAMVNKNEYDPVNDYQLFEGDAIGNIILKKKYFILFEPQDVHKTGLNIRPLTQDVKKIVIKLKVL